MDNYRPYALVFPNGNPALTTTTVTVQHVDESARGIVGLPIEDELGVSIGNYPNYYWLVDASTSLGASQTFDVELTGTEPFGVSFEDEEDLRIIRRFDGNAQTNQWRLQGDANNYDNILTVDEASGDSTAVARNIGSTGGIVEQGARFTIGIPSSANQFAPTFTSAPDDTLSVPEDSTLRFNFQARAVAEGRELSFSLENAPNNASFTKIPGHAANLTAEQSVANGGVGSGTSAGSGSVSLAINTDSEGDVAFIDYRIELAGFDFSTFAEDADSTMDTADDVIGLHLHPAAAGDQGPVVFGIVGSQDDALNPLSPTMTNA